MRDPSLVRRILRIAAPGVLLFAVACNLLTGVGDLDVRAAAGGGDDAAPVDGATAPDPDAQPSSDAGDADVFIACPGLVAPIHADFDDDQLGADWNVLPPPGGGGVVVRAQRLELTNGGAVVASRAMDPGGGIRVFGRMRMVTVAPTGTKQSFAIYTRSDGSLAANGRPNGVGCVLEDMTPVIKLDGLAGDGGAPIAGGPLFNSASKDLFVDFDIFDDGSTIRCNYQVNGSADLGRVVASTSWRPAGPNRILVQSQANATSGLEWVGAEHGIAREPRHHYEFEDYFDGNPFNDGTIEQVMIPGEQYNGFRGPLSRGAAAVAGRVFGGYGVLLAASSPAGFSLEGTSCCSQVQPHPSLRVVSPGRDAFTAAFWIRVDRLPDPETFFTLFGNGGADGGLDVRLLPGGAVRATLADATRTLTINTPAGVLTDGKWAHVTLRRDAASADLLLDGVPVGSTTGDAGTVNLDNPRDLLVGARADDASTAVENGAVDSIKIYDAALSDCEILILASRRP